MGWIRSRRIAVLGLLVFLSCFALFYALQLATVNVPVTTRWVTASVSLLAALPVVALLLSLLSIRFDQSKWLAWIVMLMSGALCVWLFFFMGMAPLGLASIRVAL